MEKRSRFNLHFLPEDFQKYILKLKEREGFSLELSRPRKSKLGDYRYNFARKSHHITINVDLEPTLFMITFLHEVAHKICQVNFGRNAAPHGKEWKSIFSNLLLESLSELKLNSDQEKEFQKHIISPKAKFQKPAIEEEYLKVSDLQPNTIFEIEGGRTFQLIQKRRTRYLCVNLSNMMEYTVLGTAPVKKVVINP